MSDLFQKIPVYENTETENVKKKITKKNIRKTKNGKFFFL
jgi:hypothetical protein